jgi:hypothetical protein
MCACDTLMSAGGCGDLCDQAKSGASAPDFCNGVPALTACAACIEGTCHFPVSEAQDAHLCKP